MIRILLLDTYRQTIDLFIPWARFLEGHLRTVAYESLSPRDFLVGGTFIFSDLDRLTNAQRDQAAELAATIKTAGGRVMNDPSRVLRRHDLLRALYAAGENPFNVFHPHELDASIKFPVFLRHELQHTGAMTGLLNNMDELKRALDEHQNISDLMIVEYLHTVSDADGLFRKFSLLRIGDRLIPRHIHFSSDWVNKSGSVFTDQSIAEENEYIRNPLHTEQVWKIFKLSEIDYGRIDYSVQNGKIVTWEINTNPTLRPPEEKTDPRRILGQVESSRQIREAFLALDQTKSVTVNLSTCPRIVPPSDITKTRKWTMLLSNFWKHVGRHSGGTRVLQAIVRSIEMAIDLNPPGPPQ